MIEQIKEGLDEMGLCYDTAQLSQLETFVTLLLQQNQVMNLTAITEIPQIVGLHLLDSATLCHHVTQGRLLDLGTGAGFPAIPLKILCPSMEMTLLDALQKRLDWLETLAEALDLTQVETLHGRGEDLGHDPFYRESYDVVTARAVADLRILAELALPFVKVGGRFLAMKGCDSQEELEKADRTITALGGRVIECRDHPIPQMNLSHRVIVVEKVASTPSQYPRRWAKIKKSEV